MDAGRAPGATCWALRISEGKYGLLCGQDGLQFQEKVYAVNMLLFCWNAEHLVDLCVCQEKLELDQR